MGRLRVADKPEEAETDLREADALYAALGAGPPDGPDVPATPTGTAFTSAGACAPSARTTKRRAYSAN